jgi:hypothetical protein
MFVGTRSEVPDNRLVSVTLYRKPASNLEGAEIGRLVRSLISSKAIRDLGDGPFGGTPILIGEEKVGEALTAPLEAGPWPLCRINDHALAQVAYQLTNVGSIWLPGATSPNLTSVSVCCLRDLGEPGPYHLDVSSAAQSGGVPRGPFELVKTSHPQSVTFPVLAAHDEKRERYLEIAPDMEGLVRHVNTSHGKVILDRRRDAIRATRTKLHFATDARFNANALIACLTTRDAIGGRAWPSFLLHDRRYEKAVALWFNSSLGILVYWWLSSKSQDGRGSITTTRLGDLVTFDPRSLSEADLNELDIFFEYFKSKPLLDIHECAIDTNRAELDRFVLRHFLKDLDAEAELNDGLQLLRAKLAIEPSITGGRQLGASDERHLGVQYPGSG